MTLSYSWLKEFYVKLLCCINYKLLCVLLQKQKIEIEHTKKQTSQIKEGHEFQVENFRTINRTYMFEHLNAW